MAAVAVIGCQKEPAGSVQVADGTASFLSVNLNAANAAMESGDFKAARNYLRKAGESPEAIYAMGLYYMGVGEYAEAEKWLTDARKEGIIEANEMLSQCAKLKEYYTNNY